MENEYRDSNVNRWIVSQRFAAEIVPGVRLSNTWGLDTYLDERRTYQNERPWRTADGLNSGGTRQEKLSRTQMNNDLVAHRGPDCSSARTSPSAAWWAATSG